MKKLFLSAIAVVLAGSAYAQLNTFKEGDVISAEQMNENFQHLEQQLQGAIEKAVNCAAGEKIGEAIDDGYTNITVSGTCTENLQFSMWREDSAENGTPTGKLAPRFLRIAGADASAKIVDASSDTESTVSVNSGATLFMENITVSGGENGVNAQRNSNLYLSGVIVENFSGTGLRVADSAWLGIDDDGATLVGTGAGNGIELGTGSSGWISTITISDVDRGIGVYHGSTLLLGGYSISAASRGIYVSTSRVLKYGDGAASIEGTSDRAVSVSQGVFTNWDDGTLEIKNLNGGRGIDLWQSKASINNLKLLNFNNTGSGWNPAIRVGDTSALNLNNSEISGETDSSLINIDRSSMLEVNDSTISGTTGDSVIYAGRESLLDLENSEVSGNAESLISIDRGSTLQIESGTLSGTIEDALIGIHRGSSAEIRDESELTVTNSRKGINVGGNSHLDFKNSQITGTVTDSLIQIWGGASAQISDSTMTVSSQDTGISIYGSSLEINNLNITGEITDNLFNITQGSNAKIWDSTIKMTGIENWNSAILLSAQSSLTISNSNVESNKEGLRIERNSFADFRGGSSITAGSAYAAGVRGSSGMRIRSGSEISSEGAAAMGIKELSYVIVEDGAKIDRTDAGVDVELGSMSSLNIWDGTDVVGEVSCWGRSLVFANESAITNELPDDCKDQ